MGNPEKWIWKFWSATIFPSKFAMQTQWNTAIHILGAHTIKNLCQKCESNPSILLTTQEWLQFSQRCRMCFISCLSFSHVLLEHAKTKVTDFHWSRSLSPFLLIPFFLEFFSILFILHFSQTVTQFSLTVIATTAKTLQVGCATSSPLSSYLSWVLVKENLDAQYLIKAAYRFGSLGSFPSF